MTYTKLQEMHLKSKICTSPWTTHFQCCYSYYKGPLFETTLFSKQSVSDKQIKWKSGKKKCLKHALIYCSGDYCGKYVNWIGIHSSIFTSSVKFSVFQYRLQLSNIILY